MLRLTMTALRACSAGLLLPSVAALGGLLAAVGCQAGEAGLGGDRLPGLGVDELPLRIDQRCPGAADCLDDGDDVLYAGYAARDITPEVESFVDENGNRLWDVGEPFVDRNGNQRFDAYWLAGDGGARLATGVAAPLSVRALALRQNRTTVVLLAVDGYGLLRDDNLAVQRRLDRRLEVDLLLLHATRDHQAPDLTGGFGPSPTQSGIDDAYHQLVLERLTAAATAAVEDIRPARLTVGATAVAGAGSDLSRFQSDSRDPVVIDPALHTLQLIERDEVPAQPIATVVNWASHADAAGVDNRLLGADFIQPLRDELERHSSGPVLYISGPIGGHIGAGRATPIDELGQPQSTPGLAKARALGLAVAAVAARALADPAALTVEGRAARLAFRTALLAASLDNLRLRQAAAAGSWAHRLVAGDGSTAPPRVESAVAYLALGPARIVTSPGELAPELFLGGYDGSLSGGYPLLDPRRPQRPDLRHAPTAPYLVELMDGEPRHRLAFGQTLDDLGPILPRYDFVVDAAHPYFVPAAGDHLDELSALGPRVEGEVVGTMRQLVLAK